MIALAIGIGLIGLITANLFPPLSESLVGAPPEPGAVGPVTRPEGTAAKALPDDLAAIVTELDRRASARDDAPDMAAAAEQARALIATTDEALAQLPSVGDAVLPVDERPSPTQRALDADIDALRDRLDALRP